MILCQPIMLYSASLDQSESDINKIQEYKSENFSTRVRFIVIHFTSIDFENSLKVLTKEKYGVSSHYLIPETGDKTFTDDLKVFQLVEEQDRAYHAGVSSWEDRTHINDQSIGIELVNQAECSTRQGSQYNYANNYICIFPDYDEVQIEKLILLLKEVISKHDEIKPTYIIGHSDVAPDRKYDPGPKFPWKKLYENGIGAWYDEQEYQEYMSAFRSEIPNISQIQCALKQYGYGIDITGKYDEQTFYVLRAFQYHFTPEKSNGQIHRETISALWSLLNKYFPESFKGDTLVCLLYTSPSPRD